jgi:hypothetical protein
LGTILEVAKDAAVELSLESFANDDAASLFSAFNDGDSAPQKLLRSLTKTCKALGADYPWQAMRAEHVFACLPAENQPDVIPEDFDRFIPGTWFDRTSSWRLVGPISEDQWQAIKAFPIGTSVICWMQRGDDVLLYPTPENGRVLAFGYQSNAIGWSRAAHDQSVAIPRDSDVFTPAIGIPSGDWRRRITRFTEDANVTLWADELVTLGVVANYLKIEQSQSWPTAMSDFERMTYNRLKADGGVRAVNFAGPDPQHDYSPADRLRNAAVVIRVPDSF